MPSAPSLGFSTTEQELCVDRLPVRGQIPTWLQGSLIRNGPGTFQVGEERYRHWFDGLAMLHRFSFREGQVAYANKFLNGQAYRAAQQTGRIVYPEFATDPQRSLWDRIKGIFSPKVTDNAKINVAQLAGRYLALAETPIQVAFDPHTLETLGTFSYGSGQAGQMTTAHPQFDVERDQAYNLEIHFHRVSHYRFYQVTGDGSSRLVASLPVKQPAYMHSFGLSPNYFILTEFPLVVNPLSLMLWLKPYIENYRWQPERGTLFWVVDRRTGELVGRYQSEPFFAFHHVNAFELGDELIVDLVAYPDAGALDAYYLERLESQDPDIPFGQLRRYRIPLQGQRASHEPLSSACMELPHFDYWRFNMNPDYRFVYAVSIAPQNRQSFYDQLVKVDVQTGQEWGWAEADCYPGEPVLVSAPGSSAEDEGVILSVVLDAAKGCSFLLVLDAQTFTARARAEIPHPVLFGYHGAFFSF